MDFDKEFYKNVTALKGGRAKRKVSLALGGWNDSKGDKYSRLVNDPKARRYVPRIYYLEDCYWNFIFSSNPFSTWKFVFSLPGYMDLKKEQNSNIWIQRNENVIAKGGW